MFKLYVQHGNRHTNTPPTSPPPSPIRHHKPPSPPTAKQDFLTANFTTLDTTVAFIVESNFTSGMLIASTQRTQDASVTDRFGNQVKARYSNDTLISSVSNFLAEKDAHTVKNADAEIYTVFLE